MPMLCETCGLIHGPDDCPAAAQARIAELEAENARLSKLADVSIEANAEAHGLHCRVVEMEGALEGLCNFAWSIVGVDHQEARDNLNAMLKHARQTLKGTGSRVADILAAARELAERAEKKIYPQPDKPNSDWAVLRRLQDALDALDTGEGGDAE